MAFFNIGQHQFAVHASIPKPNIRNQVKQINFRINWCHLNQFGHQFCIIWASILYHFKERISKTSWNQFKSHFESLFRINWINFRIILINYLSFNQLYKGQRSKGIPCWINCLFNPKRGAKIKALTTENDRAGHKLILIIFTAKE